MAFSDRGNPDYHLMNYYPYKGGQGRQDRDSQTIVYWKAGYLDNNSHKNQERKREFSAKVLHWLEKSIAEVKSANPSDKIIIGIAPDHKPGSGNPLMTGLGVKSLHKDPVSVDLTLLQRYKEVPKQATSIHDVETHLDSIEVVGDVAGKVVCILDDIWTSGCTLRACHQIVTEQGAKKVYLLAIGKIGDLHTENLPLNRCSCIFSQKNKS